MSNKRIAILVSDDWHQKYLISYYAKCFNVVQVIIEPAHQQRMQLIKKKKYVNFIYALYHKYRRQLQGLDSYRKDYFKFNNEINTDYPVEIVNDINCARVYELLKSTKPDVTIVVCTNILKEPILDLLEGNIINIHGGYLPDYRGNHCFFFAFYKRDFSKIGSTLHFIDKGIDTGDIIEHIVPVINEDDFPESLYCKAEMKAIHRLAEILENTNLIIEIPRFKQPYRKPLYKTKDRGLLIELIYHLRLLTGQLKVK